MRHEALRIDTKKKEVHAKDLEKSEDKIIPYDKLVIATGGLPIRPPLPGIDLERVFTIRTLIDGIEIKKYIDQWTTFDVCVGPVVHLQEPLRYRKKTYESRHCRRRLHRYGNERILKKTGS